MENASKALLIVGGILLGILILALMVTLFQSSRELFDKYNETRRIESIQQFNVNFIKYVGQKLTIHQVVTIVNFAKDNQVIVTGGLFNVEKYYDATRIDEDVKQYKKTEIITYKLEIVSYTDEGYIKEIKITQN